MVDGSGLEMYSFQGDVSWYLKLDKRSPVWANGRANGEDNIEIKLNKRQSSRRKNQMKILLLSLKELTLAKLCALFLDFGVILVGFRFC